MNILLLSPWLPWPPFDGARSRIFETLRYLSYKNRVTLIASVRRPEDAENVSALDEFCEKIITVVRSDQTQAILRRLSMSLLGKRPLIQSFHYNRQLAYKVQELTAQEGYDIIHIEFPFMAPYLASIRSGSRAKKVLSMHNIESIKFKRELSVSSWGGRRLVLLGDRLFFKSWEAETLHQFDGISVVSKLEQAWVRQHAPTAVVELVPNGVDIDYYSAAVPSHASRSIVFTGLMDYPPNVDAVVWFCNEVLPILHRKHPEACFKIVGDKPARQVLALAQRQGVQVTGQVPDIRPYIADCFAFVVPLRSGGGTRLKILQAMAMQRPVVSTRVGAEGLEVTPGVHLLMGDSAQELATHLLSLITAPQLGERLGKAGRHLVETHYDWQICFKSLERLYDTLTSSATLQAGARDRGSPPHE